MQVKLLPYQLNYKETFRISRAAYTSKNMLIVALSDGKNTGFGEACEHGYYQVTIPKLIDVLRPLRPLLATHKFDSPQKLWSLLKPKLEATPFAQCALDVAAWDLYGKQKKRALYQLWGLQYQQRPITDYTIGIDSIKKMQAKVKAFPFPLYKIKLGTEYDMDIMRAIRAVSSARLQIDANCAWTSEQTIEYSVELKKLGVELIEQPLKADDWDGMKEVFKYSQLPVYADEACVHENDVQKCAGVFHGINIKLMKCGGITPARRMIQKARDLGLKVMMGCMTEASIGISAIAHFLPLLDYVDMDGTLLSSNDPATGVQVHQDGTISFPKEYGTGASLISQLEER